MADQSHNWDTTNTKVTGISTNRWTWPQMEIYDWNRVSQIDCFAQFDTDARKNYVTHKTSKFVGRQEGWRKKPIGSNKAIWKGAQILAKIKSKGKHVSFLCSRQKYDSDLVCTDWSCSNCEKNLDVKNTCLRKHFWKKCLRFRWCCVKKWAKMGCRGLICTIETHTLASRLIQ